MEYESKLSDIIASLPEVNGGFLYNPARGIYSNQSAGTGDDISLQHVSEKLSKTVSMFTVHFHDTRSIRVTFRELILHGQIIEDNHWLFLLHQPSLSSDMVKMTVQMALNIKDDDEYQQDSTFPAANIAESETEAVEKEPILAILMKSESELRKPLTAIQDELAVHIGPVAQLAFQDAIKTWNSSNTPSLESLPALLSLLEEEIDDDKSREIFRSKLRSAAGEQE